MGDQAILNSFAESDGFLRRTDRKNHIREGVVNWEAFKPRKVEPNLSFTFQAAELCSEESLKRYQIDKRLPLGDLPGICRLSYSNLIGQSLPPRYEIDHADVRYGKLHHVTDLPKDQLHMEVLAFLATQNKNFGLPFPLVKHKKQSDHSS